MQCFRIIHLVVQARFQPGTSRICRTHCPSVNMPCIGQFDLCANCVDISCLVAVELWYGSEQLSYV